MDIKQPIGRPRVKDKKEPVTFMAKKSEKSEGKKRAKLEGKTLPEKMYELLYDYISR